MNDRPPTKRDFQMRLHSDGHTEAEPALRACWDADRLDLSRVGITPEPRYLCTEHGRRELPLALKLPLYKQAFQGCIES